jgi:xanthine dehydrogenase YagR molybdenum-binding subunit
MNAKENFMENTPSVGQSINRLEGHLKVTGQAKYAAEYDAPDLLYGYIVNSSITKGKIKTIDTSEIKKLEGVIEVFTHEINLQLPGLIFSMPIWMHLPELFLKIM